MPTINTSINDRHPSSREVFGGKMESLGVTSLFISMAIVYFWFAGIKCTAIEAEGLVPLVSTSPILGWLYSVFSARTFSMLLGVLEMIIGFLFISRFVSPAASAVGALLSVGLFVTTLSFMVSTPGVVEPSLGFPGLSLLGQFLLKDIVLLGVSVFAFGNSLRAIRHRPSNL